MAAASLINISHGNRCEAKKNFERSGGVSRQQQPGSITTPSMSSFSPGLGASPELLGKSKARNHRSSDVGRESSGEQ